VPQHYTNSVPMANGAASGADWLVRVKDTKRALVVMVTRMDSAKTVQDVVEWAIRHGNGTLFVEVGFDCKKFHKKAKLAAIGVEIGSVLRVMKVKPLLRPPHTQVPDESDAPNDNFDFGAGNDVELGTGPRPLTHEQFWTQLRDHGLRQQQERGDGNCLYRAIARQIFGDAEKQATVREDVARHIVQHRESFDSHYVLLHVDDFDLYIAGVRGREHATHLEVMCAEELYNRRVDIFLIEECCRTGVVQPVMRDDTELPHEIACDDIAVRVVLKITDDIGHYDSLLTEGQPYPGAGDYTNTIGQFRGRPSAFTVDPIMPNLRIDKIPDDVDVEPVEDGGMRDCCKKNVQQSLRKQGTKRQRKESVMLAHTASGPTIDEDTIWVSMVVRPPIRIKFKTAVRWIYDACGNDSVVKEVIDGSGLQSYSVRLPAQCLQKAVELLQAKRWECIVGELDNDSSGEIHKERASYQGNYRVCSWNINSYMGKRNLVAVTLEQQRVAVCMMQETWRNDSALHWRMPDHNVIEKRAITGLSRNGVAILYHKTLCANEIPFDSDYLVAADVNGEMLPERAVCVSVYIPNMQPGRDRALADLENFVQHIHGPSRLGNRTIIAGGDLNMKRKKAISWAAKMGLYVLDVEGSAVTRHTSTGKMQGDIDHLLVGNPELWKPARVMDNVPEGDHWPIAALAVKRGKSLAVKKQQQRRMIPAREWVTRVKGKQRRCDKRDALVDKVTNHEAFQNLLLRRGKEGDAAWRGPIESPEEVHEFAKQLQEACWKAAEDAKLVYDPKGNVGNKWILDGFVRKLVRTRVRAYQRFRQRPNAQTYMRYTQIRDSMVRMEQRRSRAKWAHFPASTMSTAPRGNKRTWSAVDKITTPDTRGNCWQPVYDLCGNVVTTPTLIKAAISEHFDALSGTGDDGDHNVREWKRLAGPQRDAPWVEMPDITLAKMVAALRRMSPGKAPGPDGIPADLLKMMVDAEAAVIRGKRDSLQAVGMANQGCIPSWAQPEDGANTLFTRAPPKLIRKMMHKACRRVQKSRILERMLRNGARKRRRLGGGPLPQIADVPAFNEIEQVPRSGSREAVGKDAKSAMAAAYLRLLNGIWKFSTIPTCWEVAALVVLAKKGGDPLSLFSKRGISLMNSGLKLMGTIGKEYVEEVFIKSQVIIAEQAGFRAGEECVGQITALYEVCQRRLSAKKETYLLYVDFKQAFDKVSHAGMIAKLAALGVDDKFVEFIRALYASSTVRVRFSDGTMSLPIGLKRGVRQGCPLSPDLFKLFINDIIEFLSKSIVDFGVNVAGMAAFKGLLFADDLVLAAESKKQLWRVIAGLAQWADINRLPVNVAKCGIVVVCPKNKKRKELEKELEKEVQQRSIDGNPIPIVSRYTYLGVPLNGKMSCNVMAKSRLKKGRGALSVIRPLLLNEFIPICTKADVIYSKMVSTMLYAVELWGTVKVRLKPLQKLLMKAVRMAAGVGKSAASAEVLLAEFGLKPLELEAEGRITRFWQSSARKMTWIGSVRKSAAKAKRGTWTCDARRVVRRVQKCEGVVDGASCHEIVEALWKAKQGECKKATWGQYKRQDFAATRLSMSDFVWSPAFGKGLKLLMKARMGALSLAPQRARMHRCESFCWCCERIDKQETVEHLILHCSAWKADRYNLLKAVISGTREILINNNRPGSAENVCSLLLGGAVDGVRIENWGWEKHSEMDAVEEGLESEDTVLGAGLCLWASQPVSLAMAAYFQSVMKKRNKLLWGKVEWLEATLGCNPLSKPVKQRPRTQSHAEQ